MMCNKPNVPRKRTQRVRLKGIQLLESPIPAAPPAPPSQKTSSDDILGTKRGTIDPLVSK